MQEALENAFKSGVIEVGPNKGIAIVSGKKILFRPFLGEYFPYDTIVLMRRMNALPDSDLNFALFTNSAPFTTEYGRRQVLSYLNQFFTSVPTHKLMFRIYRLLPPKILNSPYDFADYNKRGIELIKEKMLACDMAQSAKAQEVINVDKYTGAICVCPEKLKVYCIKN